MSDRFFCEQPIIGNEALLAGPAAHHLLHVMRAKVGDRVMLFDGSGAEFEAEVQRTARAEVELEILARQEVDRESRRHVTLGVALPKGDRQKVLVEKLTELGVARLVPLSTSRSVASPSGGALEKLRRQVIEASKQCGRNRLMEITEPAPLNAFLHGFEADCTRLIAHPSGGEPFTYASEEEPLTCAIGPEGGFDLQELEMAQKAGWRVVSLGSTVLRVETAAIAFGAIAAHGGVSG